MKKSKKKRDADKENSVPELVIKNGEIKDGYCIYSYEQMRGIGRGFTHNVKNKTAIILQDMREAFRKFNVHLACIDDVFKHSGVEVTDIDQMENHELVANYRVTGFKISGIGENECIALVGTKFISCSNGEIKIETPAIVLDEQSSYRWGRELLAASNQAREEVLLYHQGKYEMEEELPLEDPAQLSITDINLEEAQV